MVLKSHAHSERRLLAGGATLSVFGIAMSTGEQSSLAGVLTLGGLVLLIVGLHRFGRTGPDPALAREPRAKRGKTKATRAPKVPSPPPDP